MFSSTFTQTFLRTRYHHKNMTDYKIVTAEAGDCDCGRNHDKDDTLWSGFITRNAAEAELAEETRDHSIELEIQPDESGW